MALTLAIPVDKPVDNLSPILGTIMEISDLEIGLVPHLYTIPSLVRPYALTDQDQGTAWGRS